MELRTQQNLRLTGKFWKHYIFNFHTFRIKKKKGTGVTNRLKLLTNMVARQEECTNRLQAQNRQSNIDSFYIQFNIYLKVVRMDKCSQYFPEVQTQSPSNVL